MQTDLPKDWSSEHLGDSCDHRTSNVDKKTKPSEPAVRLCNYTDVYREDRLGAHHPYMVASATYAEMARFRLQVGDVIITKDSETPDDIGVPSLITALPSDLPLVCGYHLTVIRPGAGVVPAFLAKQIGHARIQSYFAVTATGTTRYGLSNRTINEVPLWLPCRPEQGRIAEILDTIDEAISKTEQVIHKLQQMKQGLLHDLLTRGIDENGELRAPERHPEQFKPSPLGRIPKGWEVGPLSERIAFITDYRGMTPPYTLDGVAVISAENVGGGVVKSTTKWVSAETYRRTTTRGFPEAGDTIFTTEAPVAEVARLPGDETYRLTRRVIALRPKMSVRKDFLYWSMFRLSEIGAWNGRIQGSTVPRILKPDILACPFSVPSLVEQTTISSILDTQQARICQEEEVV